MKAQPFEKMIPQLLIQELRLPFHYFNVPIEGYTITIEDGYICANGTPIYQMPPGNWQLICTSKECTEDQAEDIVDPPCGFISLTYQNYEGGPWYDYATLSLRSLLRSKGCNPELNYAILKKI